MSQPYQPVHTFPAGDEYIDPAVANVFTWEFSDPTSGDYQAHASLNVWNITDATNIEVLDYVALTDEFYSIAGATFTAGKHYYWYTQLWDQWGNSSAVGTGAYFWAAAPPAVPVISDPVDNDTITTMTYAIVWAPDSAEQDYYQVRRVADAAGSPNTAIVYEDSGAIGVPAAVTYTLTLDANSRVEHWQVRVKYNGVWSAWATLHVHILFVAPVTPTLVATASSSTGKITVVSTFDTGRVAEPVTTSYDVYRTADSAVAADAIRIAAAQTVTAGAGTYEDYQVADGVVYRYIVRAIAANTAFADSALTA